MTTRYAYRVAAGYRDDRLSVALQLGEFEAESYDEAANQASAAVRDCWRALAEDVDWPRAHLIVWNVDDRCEVEEPRVFRIDWAGERPPDLA